MKAEFKKRPNCEMFGRFSFILSDDLLSVAVEL